MDINKQREETNLIIKKLTGQNYIIATNKYFKSLCGDYNAANFLSQLIYWSDRTDKEYFYKSAQDWENELFFSEQEVRTCKSKLENKQFITTKIMQDPRGVPKTHYKVNMNKIHDDLIRLVKINKWKCLKQQFQLLELTFAVVGISFSSYYIDYKHRLQTKITDKREESTLPEENDNNVQEEKSDKSIAMTEYHYYKNRFVAFIKQYLPTVKVNTVKGEETAFMDLRQRCIKDKDSRLKDFEEYAANFIKSTAAYCVDYRNFKTFCNNYEQFDKIQLKFEKEYKTGIQKKEDTIISRYDGVDNRLQKHLNRSKK